MLENKIVQVLKTRMVTYRQEKRMCGKRGCKGCPHGPYWYAYYYERGNGRRKKPGSRGRLKTYYIGKTFHMLPFDNGQPRAKERE